MNELVLGERFLQFQRFMLPTNFGCFYSFVYYSECMDGENSLGKSLETRKETKFLLKITLILHFLFYLCILFFQIECFYFHM